MTDISMCMSSTCPLKDSCYRNTDSGTKPSARQSWFIGPAAEGLDCKYYWPLEKDSK